jgi:GNAT superfamily N-acetyltransferase
MVAIMLLRPARAEEAAHLSELALRSKGHWGYDADFLAACRAELTIAAADVVARRVTVAEVDGRAVGFYTLDGDPPVVELGQMFVDPAHIGAGVGRALWRHAVEVARDAGVTSFTIDADPYAEAFYLAMGAVRTGTVPSGSVGGRVLPRLTFVVTGTGARG